MYVGYTISKYKLANGVYISLTFQLRCTGLLHGEEDRSILVATSAGFTFKLVFENHVAYMLRPAEKPHFRQEKYVVKILHN